MDRSIFSAFSSLEARMRLVPFAALACLVLAGACGSDSPTDTGDNNLANGSFSARIDGNGFNATAAAVVASGGIVSIGAGNASGRTIGVAWVDTGAGTYSIGSTIGPG